MIRVILILSLMSTMKLYCQENIVSNIIYLPDYYKGNGVLFNTSSDLPILLPEGIINYKPSINELKFAEKILLDSLPENNFLDKQYINKLWKFGRQYFGYIENNDRIIIIQTLDFPSKRKTKLYFGNWMKEYVVGVGDFYEKRTRRYKVNIDLKELSIF